MIKRYYHKLLYLILIAMVACNGETGKRNTEKQIPETPYQEISREAFNGLQLAKGETVYVPVYSDIYGTDIDKKIKLAATLSIRNTNMDKEIIVSSVDYYDTHGNLIRQYLSSPVKLKPLQTVSYLVEYKEAKGGTGANFIVEWVAEQEVTEPIIEAVMIGTSSALGISFVCEGKVIRYITE